MPDIVFYGLALLLTVLGMGVLWLALVHDRPRGRRRCPKCWYDLTASGEENLRCSECGYLARNQRMLRKTRRHWRWAMLGVVLLGGALVCNVPKIRRDGAWYLAPNTVLILMSPDSDDAFTPTPVKDEALRRLVEDRLDWAGSFEQVLIGGLWDWQYRMLCKKSVSYFNQTYPSVGDPTFRLHRRVLHHTLDNGIVHRIGIDRDVCNLRTAPNTSRIELFGSTLRKNGRSKFFSDQPIGFGIYHGGPFGAVVRTTDLTVTIDDRPQPLRWERIERPYEMTCWTGETNWLGAFYLPEDLSDGTHAVSFRLTEHVGQDDAPEDRADNLFVADYTLEHQIETAGSYHDFIRPDNDPRLDERVRRNVRFEIEPVRNTVHVYINPYWMKLSAWIGKIWRLELIRDGQIVGSRSQLLSEHDRVYFSTLPQFPEVYEDNVNGDWILRFQMDPQAMIIWNQPSDYWAGVIEVPIDWKRETRRIRSMLELPRPAAEQGRARGVAVDE